MKAPRHPLPWLQEGDPFPALEQAWDDEDPAPGLLAASASVSADRLIAAYRGGVFPWYSAGQPVLWWSPDPRTVLRPAQFKLHDSLRKTLKRFVREPSCQVRIDHDFGAVIGHCANTPRTGQNGTWIVPEMVQAYQSLHAMGLAHSVETWMDGELVGGLYCVGLGRMVFGESMFAHRRDASKIALSALVALCRAQGLDAIDCQQNTAHLGSLGAAPIARPLFAKMVAERVSQPCAHWQFDPLYWRELL
jgi:leucyl/phenylalanyl-tRNA---protein transferase